MDELRELGPQSSGDVPLGCGVCPEGRFKFQDFGILPPGERFHLIRRPSVGLCRIALEPMRVAVPIVAGCCVECVSCGTVYNHAGKSVRRS